MASFRTGRHSSEGALPAFTERQTREGSSCCLLAEEDQVVPFPSCLLPGTPGSSALWDEARRHSDAHQRRGTETKMGKHGGRKAVRAEEGMGAQRKGEANKYRERKREEASQGQRPRETRDHSVTSRSVWPGPGLSDLAGGFLRSQR